MKKQGKSIKITVNEELCKGCEICISLCPLKVLEKSDKLSKLGIFLPVATKIEKCTGCRICEIYCPDLAIYVSKEEKK